MKRRKKGRFDTWAPTLPPDEMFVHRKGDWAISVLAYGPRVWHVPTTWAWPLMAGIAGSEQRAIDHVSAKPWATDQTVDDLIEVFNWWAQNGQRATTRETAKGLSMTARLALGLD